MPQIESLKGQNMIIDDTESNGTFQQQALEINLPGTDFDPNAAPTTGEEFLTHMAYERKSIPAVVSCRPEAEELNQFYCTEIQSNNELGDFAAKSSEMLTTNKWKSLQLKSFKTARGKINKIRKSFVTNKELKLPDGGDSSAWMQFCHQNPPLLSTILNLGQRDLEELLEIICEWLQSNEEESLSNTDDGNPELLLKELKLTKRWLGEWVFAILACLRLPLEPKVHSTLREIARICVRQRDRLIMPEEAKYAMTYNIFIHLIAKVFGQLDFAELV